jgi:hypothetical protein
MDRRSLKPQGHYGSSNRPRCARSTWRWKRGIDAAEDQCADKPPDYVGAHQRDVAPSGLALGVRQNGESRQPPKVTEGPNEHTIQRTFDFRAHGDPLRSKGICRSRGGAITKMRCPACRLLAAFVEQTIKPKTPDQLARNLFRRQPLFGGAPASIKRPHGNSHWRRCGESGQCAFPDIGHCVGT